MTPDVFQPVERVKTGIEGLDSILHGGLIPHRLYLVEGNPGTGKTTLALHFLLEGLRRGEPGMYVTLFETKEELRAGAESHGWSLDGLDIHELQVPEESLSPGSIYTLFHPSEVELGETMQAVLEEVGRIKPVRLAFDSLSEMRLLARDPLRYRRQILALKRAFVGRGCTVLLLDDRTGEEGDLNLQSLTHGVIWLEQMVLGYGSERRRLSVSKFRGSSYRGGYHDFKIETGGLAIFPRVVAAEHPHDGVRETISSGVAALDQLLGGGLDRGTSVLLMGPAGTGKSSLTALYALTAANRGENAAIFTFDERIGTLFARLDGIGLDAQAHIDEGRITIQQVDPFQMSPGELFHQIRQVVEHDSARLIVIDSLNGFLNALPEERFLAVQLHEMLSYLSRRGVVTLLVLAQHGVVGSSMDSPVDLSYLADTVLLTRYFEAAGSVRKAISVVKRRSGSHEHTIREFRLGPDGIRVGDPITDFHGVLSGVPHYIGSAGATLGDGNDQPGG